MKLSMKMKQTTGFIVPFIIFGAAYIYRTMNPRLSCINQESLCNPNDLPQIDSIFLKLGEMRADQVSNWLQTLSIGFCIALGFKSKRKFLFFTQLWLSWSWTWAINEIIRAIVQRPRPIALLNPLTEGQHSHHYTSFTSGHTSFITAIFVATLLAGQRQALWISFPVRIVLVSGPVVMATLRVWGGRHYVTDTLAGIALGAFTAFWIDQRLGPKNPE